MNLKEEKLNQSVYKWWLYFGKEIMEEKYKAYLEMTRYA